MSFESPLQWFLNWEKTQPDTIFLRQPQNGNWKTWTWAEAGVECRKIAAGLHGLGLPPKAHVAILSKNCAHWIMADIALMMGGYISIPIYPTLSSASILPIMQHSDAKAIIVGKLDDFAEQKSGIPTGIITIGSTGYNTKGQYNWEDMIAGNEPAKHLYDWHHNDLMTIIYTSGTTGTPKGVMHNAGTFSDSTTKLNHTLSLPKHPALFSYLPLSHIAERMGIQMNGMYSGATISFAESLTSFSENLQSVQPNIFFAVPRLWAKFQEGVLQKLPQKKLDLLLSLPLINGIIKKSIRKKLGVLQASHIYSAAAPLSVDIIKWFERLGVIICQGYGMTEDCVYGHFEFPGSRVLGSVGKPIPGLQTRFSEAGELSVKCPGLMKGYYKNEADTATLFDADGYMKTGDKAAYNHDGYLFITGRVKDEFKTDKGKYIAPAPIEMKLSANTDIEQVCVVGMGIPQPIALITLSELGKKKSKHDLETSIAHTVTIVNPQLESHEKLAKAVIMAENWTIANGLITPTMKTKRNEVEKIHQAFYPQWFNTEGGVIWE